MIGGIKLSQNKNNRDGFDGKLPEMAPLANPYVPFQMNNPPKYDARKAIIRGTLFPGLDLPFMGMVNKKELPATPLAELQTLGFALQELTLYLDTHREDAEALELYHQYQRIYHQGMEEYSKQCGPLNHLSPMERNEYEWLSDPWPWEYSKN